VDGDDVRVVEPGEQFGFAGEAFGEARFVLAVGGEDLDRDQALERFLAGLVHDAHPAAAEAFEDLELRELAGDFIRGWWRFRGTPGVAMDHRPRGQRLAQQAGGAERLRGIGGQRGAAVGAGGSGHDRVVCLPQKRERRIVTNIL